MIKDNKPYYDYSNGEIHSITPNGRYLHRKPTRQVWSFLRKVEENLCELHENEVAALNRWLMGKTTELDFDDVTSKMRRHIKMSENLINAIYNARLR